MLLKIIKKSSNTIYMRTSYNKKDITYGEFVKLIVQITNPSKIVEIGILDGYSLESFANAATKTTEIFAYDLFDKFDGNHSNEEILLQKFNGFDNVKILHGDFYNLHNSIGDADIIHIDIANNGDVFQHTINNYYPKMKKGGIIIFEGGSEDRDDVEWMNKYKKTKINPAIQKYIAHGYNIKIYGSFPSITVIKKQL